MNYKVLCNTATPGVEVNGGFWPLCPRTGRPNIYISEAIGLKPGQTLCRGEEFQTETEVQKQPKKNKQRKLPNCTPGRTYRCGKVCRSLQKPCKVRGFEYAPPGYKEKTKKKSAATGTRDDPIIVDKVRRLPRCTPGRTYRCGKVCRSVQKPCKVPGFEHTPTTGRPRKSAQEQRDDDRAFQEMVTAQTSGHDCGCTDEGKTGVI